ncbi:exodeoxyribonuclease VII large subunit [Micromonospora sp. DT62]|uniref:exodeoxyribonuclease VII large subunit n=1 Tax=Micromonospora sp. DT62 TaxID=3416521 RepID=UPI003CF48564
MTSADMNLAGLGLRWAPDTVAAAVEEIGRRAGQRGRGWQELAEIVLHDAFMSNDAVEAFKELDAENQLALLRSLPRRVLQSPRRWPVDLGFGQVPPRRLDDGATRRVLAQALNWLEERCYFGRELGVKCVDVYDDGETPYLIEVITSRLNLTPADGLHQLLAEVEVSRLSDILAVVREYVAVPPGRHFHSWNACGWHPTSGGWYAELGRRILDDVVATVAANSVLGGLLVASRQLGATVAAPVLVDPLHRTSPAAYAPAEAFLPHGSVLTVTRLVTRLAAARHLDALDAFLRAHRVHIESAGNTTSPDFVLVVEILADDQARLQRHEEVIKEALCDLAAYGPWTVRYTRPPEYRYPPETATLDPTSIATRLERAGRLQEAATALRSSFRFRPRPGTEGGVQLVTIVDDPDGTDGQVLDDAVWRVHTGLRTALAASGLEAVLLEALRPPGLRAIEERRPRVAVVTSRGHVGSDIAPKLDGEVLDVDYRTFPANAPDAATQLAGMLRTLATDATLDGVLIGRGGGDQSDLSRLVTPEVQTAINSVRQARKIVVLAIGHGTFAAELEVDFEALTPGDAAHALRAMLVDYPTRRRMAIAEAQERLAAAPPVDEWLQLVEREQDSLRKRLAAIEMEHEAALARMRQTPARAPLR